MKPEDSNLMVVVNNGKAAPATQQKIVQMPRTAQVENHEEYTEEVEFEQRGTPEFEFFTASSEEELKAQIRHWRDMYGSNPAVDGVQVMSPTVSADGKWRVAINYLVFENDMDPWS